jgi:hypothetical protein
MTHSKSAAIALLAALACTAAQASETYTYDSSPILGFGGGPGVEFTFSFTVPGTLADGSYDFPDASTLPAGFAYVATDGFLTLSGNADLFGVSGPQLTVAGGKIVSYVFYVQDLSAPPSAIYGYPTFYAAKLVDQTSDNVQLVDPSNPNIVGYDFTDAGGTEHVPQANRGDADASGFWTGTVSVVEVPEPAAIVLMGAASALLLALSRRRRS